MRQKQILGDPMDVHDIVDVDVEEAATADPAPEDVPAALLAVAQDVLDPPLNAKTALRHSIQRWYSHTGFRVHCPDRLLWPCWQSGRIMSSIILHNFRRGHHRLTMRVRLGLLRQRLHVRGRVMPTMQDPLSCEAALRQAGCYSPGTQAAARAGFSTCTGGFAIPFLEKASFCAGRTFTLQNAGVRVRGVSE